MSTKQSIFWMRVKMNAKHNISRAVELLMSIGATLAQAVRYVAKARQQVLA